MPFMSTAPLPEVTTAQRWLIVNSTDVSLCNQIVFEFSQWNVLFVTNSSANSSVPVNR